MLPFGRSTQKKIISFLIMLIYIALSCSRITLSGGIWRLFWLKYSGLAQNMDHIDQKCHFPKIDFLTIFLKLKAVYLLKTLPIPLL